MFAKSTKPAWQALGSSGRKEKQAREKETRLPHASPFSHAPTTSKRLLRRLKSTVHFDAKTSLAISKYNYTL